MSEDTENKLQESVTKPKTILRHEINHESIILQLKNKENMSS